MAALRQPQGARVYDAWLDDYDDDDDYLKMTIS
ncbi:hypothetical protein Tco_1459979, partial [Tanacetum coccineum]